MAGSSRERRPPIDINAPQEEEAGPGSLGFMEDSGRAPRNGPPPRQYAPPPQQYYDPPQRQYAPPPPAPQKSGGGLTSALGVGVFVLILSIACTFFLSASKADLKVVQDSVVASTATVRSDSTRIDSLISSIPSTYATKAELSNVAAPNLSSYATKAELDSFIADLSDAEVTALRTRLGITGTGTGTGTGTTTPPAVPTTGQVTWSLWKDVTNPIYVAGDYTWWLRIMNGFAEYKKVFVGVNMAAAGTVSGDLVVATPPVVGSTYLYAPDLQIRPTDPGVPQIGLFSMSFVPATGVKSTLISGNSQGYAILKGNSELVIPITLHLTYVAGATQFTEVVWSITALNYP